jgi:hypothetical protein
MRSSFFSDLELVVWPRAELNLGLERQFIAIFLIFGKNNFPPDATIQGIFGSGN